MEQAARLGVNGACACSTAIEYQHSAHAFSNQYWKPLINESYQQFQKIFTKFFFEEFGWISHGYCSF
jgi:hypothetical protein